MLAFFQKWAYYWCIDVFKVCSIKIFESQGCPLFDCFVDVLYNNVGLRERLRKKAKFVENLMSKEILFLKYVLNFMVHAYIVDFPTKKVQDKLYVVFMGRWWMSNKSSVHGVKNQTMPSSHSPLHHKWWAASP